MRKIVLFGTGYQAANTLLFVREITICQKCVNF